MKIKIIKKPGPGGVYEIDIDMEISLEELEYLRIKAPKEYEEIKGLWRNVKVN
jgi:hypothetical protein